MNPVILLVEDEPAIADTLAWTLQSEGFTPCHVTTGAAAPERLAQLAGGNRSAAGAHCTG